MRYAHSELIEVRPAGKKGRGVFARKKIRRGTVIERVPVVVMRVQEIFSNAPRTKLADYVFSWGRGKLAFACGYGALYNHSYQPNAEYYGKGTANPGLRRPSRHRSGRRDHGELQRQAHGPGESRLCRELVWPQYRQPCIVIPARGAATRR